MASSAGLLKTDWMALFQGWVLGTRPVLSCGPDEVAWFISKRATALINAWLNNKQLAMLHGDGVGAIVISRARVEHARDSRTGKDGVSDPGGVELLTRLFVHGTPKYVPHPDRQRYPNQLLMLEPAYKAKDAAASGESPVAALQFVGEPVAHLRLETAYWAKPAKTQALERQALRK